MKGELSRRGSLLLLVFTVFTIGLTASGICAVIDPYVLPREDKSNLQYKESPREPLKKVDESVYKKFEKEIKELTPEKRKELINLFIKKRDNAIISDRMEEAKHYIKLLEIIEKNR